MKALVITKNNNIIEKLNALCTAITPPIVLASMRGSLLDAMQHLAVEVPHLVLLDTSNINEIDMLERFSSQYPQIAFILLSEDQSPEILLHAMRAGVREVLALPLDSQAFNKAIERTKVKMNGVPNRNCKVISVIACKGGSGATFIATNVGYVLAEQFQKKVLLIDMNPYFGDAALYVTETKPMVTLSGVCAQIERFDASFFQSSLIHVTNNYSVLAASEDPSHAVDIKPEHIDTILQMARRHFDFVILDIGRQIDSVTVRALDNSDAIYPVLQLVMPYMRDGRRLLEIFRSLGYRHNKTKLIVNRYEKGGKLSLSDMLKTLAADIALTIPNQYMPVTDSINQGVPIYKLAPSSSVTKSLLSFAKELVNEDTVTKDKGFFGKVFGR